MQNAMHTTKCHSQTNSINFLLNLFLMNKEKREERPLAPPRGSSKAILTDLRLPSIHRLCCSACSGMKFPLLSFYHSFRSKYHMRIITFRCETEKSQCLNFPVLIQHISRSKMDLVRCGNQQSLDKHKKQP